MARTIYRYNVSGLGHQAVEMKDGAEILEIQPSRSGGINVWALVETDAPEAVRHFVLAPSGAELPEGKLDHIRTLHAPQGAIHVFTFEPAPVPA